MEIKIEKLLSFAEFSARKSQLQELQEKTENKELQENLNEGLLDAIVRFFKGIFDLFSDKEVKKEAESSQKYFSDIENDDKISDDEVEEEIDVKRVRKISDKLSVTIKKRIETDEEKGIRTSKNLVESLASWFGMIIVQEEAVKMPLISKMIENPELLKRFTWVPENYTKTNMRYWFKKKDCVLDETILKDLKIVIAAPANKRKNAIVKFAESYVTYVAKKTGKEEGLKSNNKEILDDIHAGFAKMASNVITGMTTIIKNTKDEKLAEVIAVQIVISRKRRSNQPIKPKVEDKAPEEDDAATTRSRKGSRKATASKPEAPESNTATKSGKTTASKASKPAPKTTSTKTASTKTTNKA